MNLISYCQKNKIQLSKSEDLVNWLTLLIDSWIGQCPIQQGEGSSEELYKMEGFYREWGQEVISKRKGKIVSCKVTFP